MTKTLSTAGLFDDLRLDQEDNATFDRLYNNWRSAEARLAAPSRTIPVVAGVASVLLLAMSIRHADHAENAALFSTLGVLTLLPASKLSRYQRAYLVEQAKEAKRAFQTYSRQLSQRNG